MHHRPDPRRVAPVVLLLALLAAGYYLYTQGSLGNLSLLFGGGQNGNTVSGYIEGDEYRVAAEIGGRIQSVAVEEGARVTAGQEVVRLDRTLLDAQLAQAQAAIEVARAQLAQVRAGARPEDVKQAETALAQAVVVRAGAQKAWENAQAARENPQELDARIAAASAQVEVLKKQLEAAARNVEVAEANAKAAAVRRDQFQGPARTLPEARQAVEQWAAAEAAAEAARAMLLSVNASVEGAQQSLGLLKDLRARPLSANAVVDQAKAAYDTAAAAVDIAQSRLDAVKAGATKEQIATAEAVVKQAEAALAVLQSQAPKMMLKSPAAGTVTRRAAQPGELAAPGATLLTIANLDVVKLTVYVPVTQLGAIRLGDEINVSADSFPGRVFKGKISHIADQAEFTPRNVQSKSERINQVFAVRIEIPNPDGGLKPGMPADAEVR